MPRNRASGLGVRFPRGRRAAEKTSHRQVFIDLRPVNVLSISEKFVIGALFRSGFDEAGVPGKRNDDRTPVGEMNDQFGLRERNFCGAVRARTLPPYARAERAREEGRFRHCS